LHPLFVLTMHLLQFRASACTPNSTLVISTEMLFIFLQYSFVGSLYCVFSYFAISRLQIYLGLLSIRRPFSHFRLVAQRLG
jgi:hypothetical protein